MWQSKFFISRSICVGNSKSYWLARSQFSSVAQSCPTLCDPMDCSTPGLPVHHQLPESTQTHVHWVSDAIQPSHSLSFPSPPSLNLSQHQGHFKWVSSLHQVAKYWSFNFSISPSNEHPGLISFRMGCILSGVISPLISSSILGTDRPGEFLFQCLILLPFHAVHRVLKARILKWFAIPFFSGPCFARTLHHDPSVLGGPTWHGS